MIRRKDEIMWANMSKKLKKRFGFVLRIGRLIISVNRSIYPVMVLWIDNLREKIDEFYEKYDRGEDPGEFILRAMDSKATELGYFPIHTNAEEGRYAVEACDNTGPEDLINAFTEMGLKVQLDKEADPSQFAPLFRIIF
jgi:hypothetical protein